jgi:uncharacterized membrane protein YbaN (DUF454 family)
MSMSVLANGRDARSPVGRAVRAGWLLLGLLCVGLGLVGTVVPLMPTTIFLILAAACFARSSRRLEAWLLAHPRFGPLVRAWREEGAMPRSAKRAACIGMMSGYGLFWLTARPDWGVACVVAALMLACGLWIVSRPEPKTMS